MAKKQLTISLLVSGRSDTTEKCLNSLVPLLNAIDSELILVDTGCDEKMQQLLRKYTSQIIPFTWCDDFAKARNAGLEAASGEWYMYMDDDEWFENVNPIINFFQSDMCNEYDQAVYKARNYSDYEGKQYIDEWVSRIIRLEEDTCFTGKVHEVLGPARGKCAKLDAFVHHYGYVHVDGDVLRGKVMRNVPLLLDMISEEPNNLRWRIQLLQEYVSIQAYDEMIETAQEAINFIANIDKRFVNQCRTIFETAMLLALHKKGDDQKVAELAGSYLDDTRNTNQGNISLCYYAMEANKQRDTNCSIAFAEKYLEFYDVWQQEDISEQESIIEQSLLFVKDVTTEAKSREVLRYYAAACISSGKIERIPEKCRKQLQQLVQRMMYKNADFINMPDDIWKVADAGLVDIETEWLDLELEQWKAALELLKSRGVVALEQARERIDRYRSRDDIRYSYFRKEYVAVFMKLESATEGYEQLQNRFFDFMEGTLKYYLWIFREEAFAGEMEMLPADAKAAAWLNQMFQREESDWQGKLADLKECASCYPVLGNNIKRFAAFIGEDAKQENLQADEARNELQQMIEIMKDKIRLMTQQGMIEEAKAVLAQVRALAPEDMELAQLDEVLQRM